MPLEVTLNGFICSRAGFVKPPYLVILDLFQNLMCLWQPFKGDPGEMLKQVQHMIQDDKPSFAKPSQRWK